MAPFALIVLALAVSTYAYEIRRIITPKTGSLKTEVIPVADFHVPLTGKVARPAYKKHLLNALRSRRSQAEGYTAVLAGGRGDEDYLVDITIGGQELKLIVDTGSSDTWVIKKDYKCFNLKSQPELESTCAFGTSGFDVSKSNTFVEYPNKNFNISYAGGEFLTGVVGFETVTVGGMTVQKQEIALVTNAAWDGDGASSGIMGLAYPELTRVYNGTDPNTDVHNNTSIYNPLFFTAVSEKVVSNPYFSIALDRGTFANKEKSTLGYVAFGGIAPVTTSSPAVTIPVQAYSISSQTSTYHYYTIYIDSYSYGSASLTGSEKEAVLDTGTTLNYLPMDVAEAYNAKIVPPGLFNEDGATYFVHCNATAPAFHIQIGGTQFKIDGKDQIVPTGVDADGNEVCVSGTQAGAENIVLGSVFLHNVVATFNIQSNQITLTQRPDY